MRPFVFLQPHFERDRFMRNDPAVLSECLAYVVAGDHENWLGGAAPSDLAAFLLGAEIRAQWTAKSFPVWRISGPLNIQEFYLPIVAETEHPTLSIKWAGALELIHSSLPAAMTDLRRRMEQWVSEHGIETQRTLPSTTAIGVRQLLGYLARRPAMYLGKNNGWALRCFLTGMSKGGDWLELPKLAELDEVIQGIEHRSVECYGSTFGGYQVYEESPAGILSWVGIYPIEMRIVESEWPGSSNSEASNIDPIPSRQQSNPAPR